MNKTTYLIAGIVVVIIALVLIFGIPHTKQTGAPVPVSIPSFVASSTIATTTTVIHDATGKAAGSISIAPNVPAASGSSTFSDKNWSIHFMLRPEWNVMPIMGANKKLHQVQIASSKYVIFVSQNENIVVGGNLTFTTATRTIAGQSIQVRTYSNVEAPFAYYQIFSVKESDATYTFLLKSTTKDTTVLDAFIASIAKK